MEFVVVTAHESLDSCQKGLKDDMTVLSIPEPFLVYTACKKAAEFAKGIVHISFAFDHFRNINSTQVLFGKRYHRLSASDFSSNRGHVYDLREDPAGLWSDVLHQQDPQHRVARRRRGL